MQKQENTPVHPLKILIVDDDETAVKLYSTLLADDGNRIIHARNGKTALLRAHEENIDLIILDLVLPDMPGTEVLKRMKDKIAHIPVIILTGNPSLDTSIEAIRTGGVYEYLIKPVSNKEFKLVVKSVLERAELSNENRRLVKKLERANVALLERVDELEKFALNAVDYEERIKKLTTQIKELEDKLKK